MADDIRPTGLQEHYPIVLNGVEYQYFKVINTKFNDSVTTHETEGGKQEDVTTRKGRKSISISVTCFQPLLASLLSLQALDQFQYKFYDPATDDYATITGRVGANTMSYNLKKSSADLGTVNGIYEVSFVLEEF